MNQNTVLVVIGGNPFYKPVCCSLMAMSFNSCTDNEGYGALSDAVGGELRMGSDLPAVEFCPWCGAKIDWEWLNET